MVETQNHTAEPVSHSTEKVRLTDAERRSIQALGVVDLGIDERDLYAEVERIIAARVATAQAKALRQARDDIKSRISTFRSLGADERYMDALNDAWGLVANRLRDAEASSLPTGNQS